MGNSISQPLVVQNIRVTRGEFSLAVDELSLRAGACVALLGANGAGKTTLLSVLNGDLFGGQGLISIFGIAAEKYGWERARAIGFVPDNLQGFRWMTVVEHLELRSRFFPAWDREYVNHLLDKLKIPSNARLSELSRGNQAKVGFVSVEGYRPPILVLDEPTTGLDPVVRRELRSVLLEALQARPGRTVLFSTHLIEDVVSVVSDIIVIANGRIVKRVEIEPSATMASRQQIADRCVDIIERSA